MIFKQYYLGCLAQASYLIADDKSKRAVLVDPRRDIDEYLADAEQLGLMIEAVFLTHFHADFVSGHIELRERCGAKIHIGRAGSAEYDYVGVMDNDRFDFGEVGIEILETPGHTPESISILVFDLAKDTKNPLAVLTGDTLFIGDVGRPDLLGSVGLSSEEMAARLYDSLHDKLMKLPDATLVYPGHGAGSMCGKNLSTDTVSTIGRERRENCALQVQSKAAFIEQLTANQAQAPQYFGFDVEFNKMERNTLDASMEGSLRALNSDEFLARHREGLVVIDTRDPDAYANGHLQQSLNIGLGGKYAIWAGTLLDPNSAILLIAEPGDEHEATMRLGRIGYDKVVGFLDGGIAAVAGDHALMSSHGRIEATELGELLAAAHAPHVLDVRSAGEREDGRHIDGDLHIPLNQLAKRHAELPPQGELIIYCRQGYRSSIALSILEGGLLDGHSRSNMRDLIGGHEAWEKIVLGLAPE